MSTAPKKMSPIEAFLALTPAEREEVTKEFDREFIAETFQPLTPEERAEWEQLQRRSKPKKPEPRRQVSVRLPRSLIRDLDALAKQWQSSRGHVILLGLRQFLRRRQEAAGK